MNGTHYFLIVCMLVVIFKNRIDKYIGQLTLRIVETCTLIMPRVFLSATIRSVAWVVIQLKINHLI